MLSHEAMQAAQYALLKGAILSLLQDAHDDGLDGVAISATSTDGQTTIDLTFLANGMPLSGHSL